MKRYAGKYELQFHENYAEYMKKVAPVCDSEMSSIIDRMQDELTMIEIKVDGDNVLIQTEYFAISILVGEPCVRELFPGIFLRLSSAFACNVLTIGFCATEKVIPDVVRDFAFTEDGLVVTYTARDIDIVARSVYTKIL